jgi:ribosomal protein S26
MPSDVTVECSAVPTVPTIEASDNCDTDVTVTFTSNTTPGSCTDEYTITRTWVATDNCGNAITHTQTITVEDNTVPTWDQAMPADVTAECSAIPAVASPIEASDNCDTDVTVTFTSNTTPGSCTDEYTITRTWVATDNCGNAITHTQTITVEDNTVPTWDQAMPADVTVECSAIPAVASPIEASDNCDTDVTVTFTSNTTPGSCTDEYTITRTWVATDNCGNAITHTQTITVEDNTAPTWDQTMPADVTVECDAIPGVASPIEASDNCDTDVTVTFTSNTTPGSCTDEYTITRTWVATDNCGNAITHTQTITVEDIIQYQHGIRLCQLMLQLNVALYRLLRVLLRRVTIVIQMLL